MGCVYVCIPIANAPAPGYSFMAMTGWTQPHTQFSRSQNPSVVGTKQSTGFGHFRSLSSFSRSQSSTSVPRSGGRLASVSQPPLPDPFWCHPDRSCSSLAKEPVELAPVLVPVLVPPTSENRVPIMVSARSDSKPTKPTNFAHAPSLDGNAGGVTAEVAEGVALQRQSAPESVSMVMSSDSDGLTTLFDPRDRLSAGPETVDKVDEVAALSAKLINAVNHQTNLDDTLAATRHALFSSHVRIRSLEDQLGHESEITMGGEVWVRRSEAAGEQKSLAARLDGEKRLRLQAEAEKQKMELELESLTTALFEEANSMVVVAKGVAKFENDRLCRTIDQLKARLAEAEGLLASQHNQLSGLKQVMVQLASERDDLALHSAQTNQNSPIGSPTAASFSPHALDASTTSARDAPRDVQPTTSEQTASLDAANNFASGCPISVPTSTAPVTSTSAADSPIRSQPMLESEMMKTLRSNRPSTYLRPSLRTDLLAYDEFLSLVRQSRLRSGSRASSGSYNDRGVLGSSSIGLGLSSSALTLTTAQSLTQTPVLCSSNTSLPVSPQSPSAAGGSPSGSGRAGQLMGPSLRETKFFKRTLVEDMEPTLRLDTAPGLSWLVRRAVLSSVVDGSLVVEPVLVPRLAPCALCGEARSDAAHERAHHLSTTLSDSAPCYPLCGYCVGRVRSTCDLVGFLRHVRDGHLRADDEAVAWEESIRLRENMFWARVGGGLVAPHLALAQAPRTSQDDSGR